MVLNGTYNNQILNNQSWASRGSGFAWAQAVPNSGTPIGVDNYPPALHCSVTRPRAAEVSGTSMATFALGIPSKRSILASLHSKPENSRVKKFSK